MLRIVHVTDAGLKPKASFQHNVGQKITNGLIRNGHFVSCFSDRDVARAQSILGRPYGIHATNKAFKEFCNHIEPDLLLLGHADMIWPKTIEQLRKSIPSMKIVQWTDDLMLDQGAYKRLISKCGLVDASLVNNAGEILEGIAKNTRSQVGYLPVPVDFSLEKGKNHEKNLPFDLFCSVGKASDTRYVCGKNWLPVDLIQHLEQYIPSLSSIFLGIRNQSTLIGKKYQDALESANIGLNLSRRNDCYLYSSDRISHICGNGMAVLVDRATGFNDIFQEDEFAFFSTMEELVAQLKQLKNEPDYRKAIAASGRKRYHDLFNERIIANYIIEVAFGNLNPKDYCWPTLAQ